MSLALHGYVVIPGVLDLEFIENARKACYAAQNAFRQEISEDRIKRASETGVIRLPMKFQRFFYQFLSLPLLLEMVDEFLGETCILHLQNAFILPPDRGEPTFQTTFHRDFPRYLNGYLASINVFFALTEFTEQNGALRVFAGSHQTDGTPTQAYMERFAEPVKCSQGSMIVFDSTLWHAAGRNRSTSDRLAVNHQFTRSFIKPQIDYCRALGEEEVLSTPPRTQKFLGYHSRPPTSLDEYYRPESERTYRKGQG